MKLSRHDIQKLEDYWRYLDHYKTQLRHRERDLLEGYCESDVNKGIKSDAISDTTGNKATILADDGLYQSLKRIIKGIERVESTLDEDERTIVNMCYRSPRGVNEWEDIAYELGYSRRKVLMIRDAIIDRTAKEINWV